MKILLILEELTINLQFFATVFLLQILRAGSSLAILIIDGTVHKARTQAVLRFFSEKIPLLKAYAKCNINMLILSYLSGHAVLRNSNADVRTKKSKNSFLDTNS